MRKVQSAAAFLLTVTYFSYVFQFSHPGFWQSGIGDWGDPNFINYLLEHWYRSAKAFTNPASPPMYFPATGTLGYSHGLILYVPVYMAVRLVLEPLQAHSITLFLVLVTGTFCLYVLLRNEFDLPFIEALLLTVFFGSSRNVVNPITSIWSQTASVFLIPPILLLAAMAIRLPQGRSRNVIAGVAGLVATLLFTQDFYTAQFALFFAAVSLVVWLVVESDPPLRERIARFWVQEHRVGVRLAAAVAVIAAAWTLAVFMSGGGVFHVFGVRFASRDWTRPALVAAAALAVLVYRRGSPDLRIDLAGASGWIRPFAIGAFFGSCVFLWIYLPAYLEHHAFWDEDLMGSLTPHDPGRWPTWDFVWALGAYDSLRPFRFAFGVGALACVPWLTRHSKLRIYAATFLFVSLLVLVAPVRFEYFSVWKTFITPLPGFSAIRDPRRIIYVYELAVVLLAAWFVTRLHVKSPFRIFISAALAALIVTDWNREVFVFGRSAQDHRHWVEAPVDIDRACRSFFVKRASETYTSRWNNPGILYNVDAMFVALKYSIPTLNGYSAWFPEDWRLFDPNHPGYPQAVARWVQRHELGGVCEFDIEERRMRPYER